MPARNATRSGIRPRRTGLLRPRAIPTIGRMMKQRKSAIRPNSRFTRASSFGLEQRREPRRAHRHRDDADDSREEAERLEEILSADRAEEHRFPREVGARGVERLADQAVVARRDAEPELRRI